MARQNCITRKAAVTGDQGRALHAQGPAHQGVYVVRMPSSYVYLSGTVRCQATVAASGSITITFSENHGLDWKEIGNIKASGEHTIDLTPYAYRRYDYRLKFELSGPGTGLESLKLVNVVQHSQAPLPTLTAGRNTITFSAGPPEGTITLEPNTDPATAAGRQLSVKDFHPVLNNAQLPWLRPQGQGDATFTIPTPGVITRVRLNLGYRLRDARDSYTALLSFDEGKSWKQVEQLTGPTPGYSRYLVFSDVPGGAKTVWVKLAGKEVNTACLFGLRIDVDYQEPQGGFRPVKITYAWHEDGHAKTHDHVVRQPQETYTIDCGPKTMAKSFSVELVP